MGEIVSWMQLICSFDLKFDEGKKKNLMQSWREQASLSTCITQGIELCFKLGSFVLNDTQ